MATTEPAPSEPVAETRKSFHQQLDDVKDEVVQLAALVAEAIPKGTDVLLSGNLDQGQAIIDADDELDRLSVDIEDRCFHLLAMQQPMARDMRALVTAIRLSSELERSGDLVVNIVKGAERIHGNPVDPRTRGLLQRLSEEASALLKAATDAYVDGDAEKAAALDRMDDDLDELHREYIHQIIEASRAGMLDVQVAVQLALVGRYYERIGDHAVNIGERTRYLVTGWLPPHEST